MGTNEEVLKDEEDFFQCAHARRKRIAGGAVSSPREYVPIPLKKRA